jgi:hypothetical protein
VGTGLILAGVMGTVCCPLFLFIDELLTNAHASPVPRSMAALIGFPLLTAIGYLLLWRAHTKDQFVVRFDTPLSVWLLVLLICAAACALMFAFARCIVPTSGP